MLFYFYFTQDFQFLLFPRVRFFVVLPFFEEMTSGLWTICFFIEKEIENFFSLFLASIVT